MSGSQTEAIDQFIDLLRDFARPVVQAGDNPLAWGRILSERGWLIGDIFANDFTPLGDAVRAVRDLFMALPGVDGADDLLGLIARLVQIAEAISRLRGISGALREAFAFADSPEARAALATDLVDYLMVNLVKLRAPVAAEALRVFGVLVEEPADELLADGQQLRRPVVRPRLALEKTPDLLQDPVAHIRSVHAVPDGVVDDNAAIAVTNGLLRTAEQLVNAMGGLALAGLPPGAENLPDPPTAADARSFTFGFSLPDLGGGAKGVHPLMGVTIEVIPASATTADGQPGPAAQVTPFGLAMLDVPVGAWDLSIQADAATGPIAIDHSGPRVLQGGEAHLSVRFGSRGPLPALGAASGPRLEPGAVGLTGEVSAGANTDYGFALDARDALIVVQASSGDGFLGRFLPADGIRLQLGFTLGWSFSHGLRFEGGAGLEVRLTPKVTLLNVLRVDEILVSVRPDAGAVALEAAASVVLTLGPLTIAIDRIGFQADLTFPQGGGNLGPLQLGFGITGPRGAGLALTAGPISGGGFLNFDPARGQYSGGLQLSIKVLQFSALGLLSTRMPDGSPGFSLLIIVTAEFPPIQLGFGFTLSGLGGLLGINRTVVLDALRDGVRQHNLDAILFPKDVVSNATRYVSDLGRIFPVAEGRFVFGPMVRLGWGPGNIISLEAALVLELPSPVRLALLGRLRAALPQPDEAVADLRLDAVGIIDFGLGEASVDASLVDSRIAAFALSGDMAVRIGWGGEKHFALSTGGFNPGFAPPPNFPALSRMALSLSESENPLLRLEAYFAVTSNTVQFGARAEISAWTDVAVVGRFSVLAYIYFDALVQLSPFHFTVDLGGGIDVSRNGRPILRAELAASLDGPSPFHATGYVEVHFLGKHRVQFEATSGDDATPAPPEIDLDAQLLDAVSHPDVWTALPPDAASGLVSLTDSSGSADILIHPLGGATLQQRLLPLGKLITRFGSAVPSRGPVTYRLATLGAGNVAPGPVGETVYGDFAPGQYDDIDGLSAPAFEAMPAGGSLNLPEWQLPGGPAVIADLGYDEAVINTPRAPAQPFPLDILARLAVAGAARRAQGFAGVPGLAVRVTGERYVVADANTLLAAAAEKVAPTSSAEARDRVAAARAARGQRVVVGAHEAMDVP